MFVTREFTFDAAHNLTDYYGKCEHLHGHTYKLVVTIGGEVQSNGLLLDFTVLKRIVKKNVLDKLDHKHLNEIIENPSAERIIIWIWDKLQDLEKLLEEEMGDPNLKTGTKNFWLHELKLWESPNTYVIYNGK